MTVRYCSVFLVCPVYSTPLHRKKMNSQFSKDRNCIRNMSQFELNAGRAQWIWYNFNNPLWELCCLVNTELNASHVAHFKLDKQ